LGYWWVNQNKTYRQEIAGGYMWSPKTNSNGGKNPYYDFMTAVLPGDIVFSFANTEIIAVGVATTNSYTSKKPKDFGAAGDSWLDEGWRVDVDFVRAETPISPKNHMNLLAPLLPEKYSPIRFDGVGNQVYLTAISHDLGLEILQLLGNVELSWPVTDLNEINFREDEQDLFIDESLKLTEKASLVLARRGQGTFRERVRFFEGSCRVTGVETPSLLIASHIKPWKSSSNEERLNGHNGLFLSPHVDKLFDGGFISFEDSGEVLVSPQLDMGVLDKWAIDSSLPVKKFRNEQTYFLASHRAEVFRSASA
jgi:putative restriction endonuclease